MPGFQTQAYYNPAPAVEGDFASANPRASVIAGPGGLVAGPAGVTIGRFAWTSYAVTDADGSPAQVNNFGTGIVAGFVHREQQGLIQNYLQEFSMVVPAGFPLTVMDAGDFWAKNNGLTEALAGQKAYADYATGKISFANAGAPGTASGSASSIAAATNSFTGAINGNVLTVTGAVTGIIQPGTTISGTGVATGTQIVSQLTGTTGGNGTYSVNIPEQVVAATTISGTYGILTVGGTVVGTFGVGDTLTGSGITLPTAITALISGTGGAGTYAVNANTVVSSTAITAGTNIETKWFARSSGLAGELVKISSRADG